MEGLRAFGSAKARALLGIRVEELEGSSLGESEDLRLLNGRI
ncbi:hypothetical protein J3D55_001090 [Chryseobacterium ginsenosidimutans]|nr:hypothetical protein [Chryseobacterium ginsenosidimutans]MCS3868173.1 hypothetical protein [Chryseobacterium ginsenosidimutans]MCS3868174.1 hypothetical protein [Chryseobacterium ginsenosidimutans]